MSDTSIGDVENPMKQPNKSLSEAMENPSVTADDSGKPSPPKNLSDMPLDVAGLIIEESDYKEQLILRKVSKSLRELVDEQKPSCSSLYLNFQPDKIVADYNEKSVWYMERDVVSSRFPNFEKWMKQAREVEKINVIVRDDVEKIAFDDLAWTLKNPKLRLESFYATFFGRESFIRDKYIKFRNILESMNHQISTKKCEIDIKRPSEYYSILPYLKPGVLKIIKVRYIHDGFGEHEPWEIMERISELDQWKQAENLTLQYEFDGFPWKYATHFKRLYLREAYIYVSELKDILHRLSQLQNFEYCSLNTNCPSNFHKLHAEVGEPAPPNDRTKLVSHYPIPDSEDYLEIMYFEESIEVTRKKRSRS